MVEPTRSGESEPSMSKHQLSEQDVVEYHDTGFLGPLTLCSPEEMAAIRERIENEVLALDDSRECDTNNRHLDNRDIYELCSHPAVTKSVGSIFGDDLLTWASVLFPKKPGGPAFPWHQDIGYWDIEPPVNVSAWIALSEVTADNGCMQLIPGSHKRPVPHVENPIDDDDYTFRHQADPDYVDEEDAVDMELDPGEFVLFNEKTLHKSYPNTTDSHRLGISVRMTLPFVKLDTDFPAITISGEDWHGINETTGPPVNYGEDSLLSVVDC